MTGQSCVPNFNSILASQGHIKEVLISISSFEPVIPLANANSQLISIVDLNQLTGPPQCKLFDRNNFHFRSTHIAQFRIQIYQLIFTQAGPAQNVKLQVWY